MDLVHHPLFVPECFMLMLLFDFKISFQEDNQVVGGRKEIGADAEIGAEAEPIGIEIGIRLASEKDQ